MNRAQLIVEEFQQQAVQESSLSRLRDKMIAHDCGTITAFRYATECGNGTVYTKAQNKQRNASLKAKLMKHGFSLTAVKGVYVENYGSVNSAREVREDVFLVSDINDTGTLEKVLRSLGEEFEQDSILFVPKGGASGTLIGTNKCEDSYPGYGKRLNLKNPLFGNNGEFMTKVNNRPFTLASESVFEEVQLPKGVQGKWSLDVASKQHWSKLDV